MRRLLESEIVTQSVYNKRISRLLFTVSTIDIQVSNTLQRLHTFTDES
jgi:hypothetical protein